MFKFLFTLVLGLWSLVIYGQKVEMQREKSDEEFKISVANNDSNPKVIKETTLVSADFTGGLGFSGVGLVAGLNFNLEVYHFLGTYMYYSQGLTSYQSINSRSVLVGYRLRDRKHIWSFEAGYGSVSYRCTSGLNFDCYKYVEETMSVFPIYVEYDFFLRKFMSMGLAVNMSFSSRDGSAGLMYILKFGYMKGNEK